MFLTCPSCPKTQFVGDAADARRVVIHRCPGHAGLTLPLTCDGREVRLHDREDYVGSEQVQLHNGRPVMAASIVRDDGEDRVVFAPAAVGGGA